ncbi:MAG: DUF885 domain-containing protein [Chitinophagales bacterium]|nr:DUF885 domain-containing protein [Chitinophagales bacterium]
MRSTLLLAFALSVAACNTGDKKADENTTGRSLAPLLHQYYEDHLKLFPLEATQNGDYRYNDQLPNDMTAAFRNREKQMLQNYLDSLKTYDRATLSENDQMSYDVLEWELNISMERFSYPDDLMPINQFWSLPLTMGQLGSGTGNQPFKTVKDYENWLGRINGFTDWCDSAIANMRIGMSKGVVYPQILIERVLPQMKSIIVTDVTKSLFYQPVLNMKELNFSDEDTRRITALYAKAITGQINPSYQKLHDFFKNEYLPKCRTTAGISAVPGGAEYYQFLIKYWTTTDMTADQVFELGQSEVKRIRTEMERVMKETGFKGDLKSFISFLHTDKQFMPFKTKEEVLNAYRSIEERQQPFLSKLFTVFPKTPFEIRETEAFREASASAEYSQGTADGSRPGIFYVPIVDPSKFNNISMEDLFLHEAIPGHHYQISLQQENKDLPEFRRFIWYGAYGEGWALYSESLGSELGLYKDPYQYFGMLSEEMHRAIRLVVDAGIHTKGWTREQAIQFSLENEAESEADITAEIERYMAIPGQALSYKIGQLKILELRKKAEQQMGEKFSLARFHDEILRDGCLPIAVLESKMNRWMATQ